jgi:hypothetical protein
VIRKFGALMKGSPDSDYLGLYPLGFGQEIHGSWRIDR